MTTNTITFNAAGDFQALYAAQLWCKKNGFSCGSTCVGYPVALKLGDFYIAKWRNLTESERKEMDGKMTSPDFRNGPVTVEIYNPKV